MFCFVFGLGSGRLHQNCHMFKLASYAVCSYCIQDSIVRYITLKKLTHLQVHVMCVGVYVYMIVCYVRASFGFLHHKLVGCSANFWRNELVPCSGLK